MLSLLRSAEVKVSFATGSGITSSLEALSTKKDIVLSVPHGKFSISYLCHKTSMSATNNEIFYAESAITSLKAFCCFPLVIVWRDSSSSLPPLPPAIIVPTTVLSPFPYSARAVLTACASGGSGQARRAQLVWAALAGCQQPTQRWTRWYHSWI